MTGETKDILAIALPTLIPSVTILVGVISNNKRLDDLRFDMNARFVALERLFDEKLRHMEDVIDARLKHLEQERQ
jgi:hypothetical protein